MYGTQYAFIMGGIFLMSFVMTQVYLPVFHELKITSNYEVGHFLLIELLFVKFHTSLFKYEKTNNLIVTITIKTIYDLGNAAGRT